MAETNVLEILDPSGHVTLRWNPDDPESVANAEAEFNRMREAGFVFFSSISGDEADSLESQVIGEVVGRMEPVRDRPEPRLEKTKEFSPRARRTVAVAPMRGG